MSILGTGLIRDRLAFGEHLYYVPYYLAVLYVMPCYLAVLYVMPCYLAVLYFW